MQWVVRIIQYIKTNLSNSLTYCKGRTHHRNKTTPTPTLGHQWYQWSNLSLFFSVGQNQPQGQSYPLQRYSEPPQQVQTYPPQGYSAPPQQAQTYTQPSAPVAYPYPRGQEVYPPKTATSAHQHSSDTGEPPSYDEVTKQKKWLHSVLFFHNLTMVLCNVRLVIAKWKSFMWTL